MIDNDRIKEIVERNVQALVGSQCNGADPAASARSRSGVDLCNVGEPVTIREKLLEAIDGAIEDLSDELLVDILLDQLKQARATLKEAQTALISEGMRAHDIEERANKELRSVRSMQGDFYFYDTTDNGSMFVVSIGPACVGMYRRSGRIDYAMMQISADTARKRMEQQ